MLICWPRIHELGEPRLRELDLPRIHELGEPRLHELDLPRIHELGEPRIHEWAKMWFRRLLIFPGFECAEAAAEPVGVFLRVGVLLLDGRQQITFRRKQRIHRLRVVLECLGLQRCPFVAHGIYLLLTTVACGVDRLFLRRQLHLFIDI